MTTGTTAFGEDIAANYEAWYESPEGRRADGLEKASLRRLLESFLCAQSILEVGSGTGHFARWLNQQGLAAIGLDLSAVMLAQARALDGVSLVRGDACRLPFADGTFGLVALVTTLEFLERPREALAEALLVTRQGLLLGVLNRRSLLGLRRWLDGLLRPTVYDAVSPWVTVAAFRSALGRVHCDSHARVGRTVTADCEEEECLQYLKLSEDPVQGR